MPRCKLTPRIVSTASADGKSKVDLFDTEVPGLLLKVLASGRKRYYTRQRGDDGKTRERKLADARVVSLNQARDLARQHLASAFVPAPCEPAPTLQAFTTDQLLPYLRSYKRSVRTDEILLRRHILPRFGDQRMDQIDRYDIQRWVQDLAATYRPATVNRNLIILRYAYNLARRWEVAGVTDNPTSQIAQLKTDNKIERFLSAEELQRLLAALEGKQNPHLPSIVSMLALTGARCSEVLHARWADIDLLRGAWRIPQPKATERRYVPLSSAMIELLQSLESCQHSAYLFPNPRTGRPFNSIHNGWNRARHEAGLPEVRLHDLRHSFASFLVNSGHSLYEVQKLLGHTKIKTTERYAHLSNERLLEASNDVGRLIANAAQDEREEKAL